MIGVASEPGQRSQPSERGHRNRPAHQPTVDDYVACEVRAQAGASEVLAPVAVVASGAGSGLAAEQASQLAISTIYAVLRSEERLPLGARLVKAIEEANQTLYQTAGENSAAPAVAGMASQQGAAVIIGALEGNTLHLAYAGNGHAYLVRNGIAHPLTVVQEGPVGAYPLGQAPAIRVATALRPPVTGAQTPVSQLPLTPGDVLVLCSAGLTDVVRGQAIGEAVAEQPAQEAAWRLADRAAQAGAVDAYTALVLEWARQPVAQRTVRVGATNTSQRRARRRKLVLMAACLLAVILAWPSFAHQLGQFSQQVENNLVVVAEPARDGENAAMADPAVGQPGEQPGNQAEAMTAGAAAGTMSDPAQAADLPLPGAAGAPPALAAKTNRGAPGLNADERAAMQQLVGQLAAEPLANPLTALQKQVATAVSFANTLSRAVVAARTATAVAMAPPTPTVTPTPIPPTPTPAPPTRTPVRQAVVRATPTVAPQPAQPDFANATVTLVEPVAGDTLNDKRPFRWTANFALPAGYAFEVIFWQKGEDPMRKGKGYAGVSNGPQINIGADHFRIRSAPPGDYFWGVLLVTTDPYQRVKYLGGGQLIYVRE
ncbi:MAG: SpoIIE family protein phosphatase [Caldilineaceae bacterium]